MIKPPITDSFHISPSQISKPDTDLEKELRRKRVEEVPQELRWQIDESLAKRYRMERIREA